MFHIAFTIVIFSVVAAAGQLGLLLDWADFRGDSVGKGWLEVYSSMRRENFSFEYDSFSSTYVGTLDFAIAVFSDDGSVADSISYSAPIKIPEGELTTKQFRILNIYQFELPVDDYKVVAVACDPVGNVCDTAQIDVSMSNFWLRDYGLSEIMLAYTAKPSSENSVFNRLGAKMFPNPGGSFDLNSLIAYYYVEVYLPDSVERSLGVSAKILQSDTVFRNFDAQWRYFAGSDGYIGGFSIAGLPDGYYTLLVELVDSSGVLSFAKKDFTVSKEPHRISKVVTPEMGENMRDILYYLLTTDQLNHFEALSPPEKMNFWKKFWASKDSSPETRKNEFMEQYLARWNYANRVFANGRKPGWRTDQGRIYIIYGPPDNIERHTIELSTNSWEVWTYFEKNYFFIFSDVLNCGEMKLVNSNVDGEVHDPYWKENLFKGQERYWDKY
ncbi:GWxTD domain-containing protein [bacterium]|nr:GWxTD domain-containing protein [bacterium]